MESVLEGVIKKCHQSNDNIALVYENEFITYSDLLRKSQQLGTVLKLKGVRPGDRVCLFVKNSIDYVIAYYAIWFSGAVVIALDVDVKLEQIKTILEHSQAFMLLTGKGLKTADYIHENKNFKNDTIYVLENLISESQSINNDNVLTTLPNPASIASIIYTSGTTGEPKGVVLTHNNIIKNMLSIMAYLPISRGDKTLNVLPFYYSYGNSILHTHLLSGATLYLENSMLFPKKIIDKVIAESITSFYGVPSTYILLLKNKTFNRLSDSHLKYIAQAGGKMPDYVTRQLLDSLQSTDLFVMYGQTEATARIAYLEPEYLQKKIGSVGRPVKDVKVEIRSEKGEVLADNVEGELYIKGENVMQGYWADQQMTKRVLIDGWLKTGDIGYIDTDGFIFLSGRNGDMLKVGGHRISPLEIEEIIIQLDFIDEVAVTGIDDMINGQVPKAVVVVNEVNNNFDREIKSYCSKNLAGYKIPKVIEYVKELPKTSSGKVKRYLL